MHDEQKELLKLINEARLWPCDSPQYSKIFNKILIRIQSSSRLNRGWRHIPNEFLFEYDDIYGEAKLRTWRYLRGNLHNYNEDRGAVMTWTNNTLAWRIADIIREKRKKKIRECALVERENPKLFDSYEETEFFVLTGVIAEKIKRDWEELSSVIVRRARPDITAYKLLDYLLTWLNDKHGNIYDNRCIIYQVGLFSEEMGFDPPREMKKFYRKKCLPYLKKYAVEYEEDCNLLK